MTGSSLEETLRHALEQSGSWWQQARPAQRLPDGDWRIWLLLGGRGAGKTLAAAQCVRAEVETGHARHIALVGRSVADIRDVMIEKRSGLLAVAPTHFRPTYEPSLRRLTWPNGAVATTFSGDEPNLLRGPEHDLAWVDELAAFERPDEVWTNLMLGLRLGQARCVVSTTPRPIPLIRDLVARDGKDVALRRMTTFENLQNLSPTFAQDILTRYTGTHLGRQELYAEILSETPGALWTREGIEQHKVSQAPTLTRIVVAIDPSVSSGLESAETGIIVAGVGENGHGYVLEDLSCRASPDRWASRAVMAYHKHRADRILGEVNNGGEMVEHVIRTVDPAVPFRAVYASRGKVARAEPVAALYEQGRVHHVGTFSDLEGQCCMYTPGEPSPDRMDALVWALTDLMVGRAVVDPEALAEAIRIADEMFGKGAE